MLDKTNHEIFLKKILLDIYEDSYLSTSLAFKGGTCLYFFYDLNRFSTDLDFNLLSDVEEFDHNKVTKILKKYLELEQERVTQKRKTLLWIGSFRKGKQRVKLEISKRKYPDKYENKNFYGFSIPIMTKDCMFAHKLCAITDRKKIQNRDLFDAWFMFEKDFPINEEIIKLRTKKDLQDYLKDLIIFLEKNATSTSILNGLGEVLEESQKNFVRDHLLKKLLFELRIRAEK